MAVALVSIGTDAHGGANPSFGQSTTAGNLLIAWVATGQTDLGAPATSASGWQAAVTTSDDPGAVGIFYKANCAAGETAPTFTNNSNGDCCLAEFSGLAKSSPLDRTGHASLTSSGTGTVTNGAADATLGELVVSVDDWILSKNGTSTTTDSYNNGATPTSNHNVDAISQASHYRFAWGTTTGNSSADSNTTTSSSMNTIGGGAALASFKLASGFPPRNPAININDPAFLMRKWQQRLRRHGRIFVPDIWTPEPAI